MVATSRIAIPSPRGSKMALSRHQTKHLHAMVVVPQLLILVLAIRPAIGGVSAILDKQLLEAAEQGNAPLVQELLAKGADVDSRDKNARTGLILAAACVHTDVVALMLGAGADVNARDKFRDTALEKAARIGYSDAFMLFEREERFQRNASKEDQDPSSLKMRALWKRRSDTIDKLKAHGAQMTLFTAVMTGDLEKAQHFLASSSAINARDNYQRTPLIWAAWKGHVEIVKYLLDNGADMNAKDHDGATALMGAAGYKYGDLGRALVIKPEDGTSLMDGIEDEKVDLVRLLLDNGADVNDRDSYGWTALMHSSAIGYAQVTKLLLDRGADTDVKLAGGSTALWLAADSGHTAVMRLLMANAESVKPTAISLEPILISAARMGRAGVVKLLIEKGVDVNVRRLTAVGLEAGVKVETPISAACRARHTEVITVLKSHGAEVTLFLAAMLGDANEVQRFLEVGSDVDIRDEHGWTPLMIAAENEHPDVIILLLQRGADVSAKNENGVTPMQISEKKGNKQIMQILKEYGAAE